METKRTFFFYFVGWFKQSYTTLHELYYFVKSCTSITFYSIPDINFSSDSLHCLLSVNEIERDTALIVSEWINSFTVANMAISQRESNLCSLATSSCVLLSRFFCVLFDTERYPLRPTLAKIFSKSK